MDICCPHNNVSYFSETVLPTSGVFTVKLAKRGNNLGIVARSETDGQKGEPVIIADIRTGSVAHRYGTVNTHL